MATWVKLRIKCAACKGSGLYSPEVSGSTPCPYCGGLGYLDNGMEVDVQSLHDYLEKILEVVSSGNKPEKIK